MGDFKPYIAVSRDRGRSWGSAAGDLPEREVVYTVIQDHKKPEILFAGTEFGLYVTLDEGRHWHGLKGGFPTIQVRDLDIQRSWNDLAVATFGRGFYILDDYTPLREMSEQRLADESAILFPTRNAKLYVEQPDRVVSRGQGFYQAENPPFGAVFTYWLRDGLETRRELRIEAENEAREAETDPPIPSMAELRSEDLEVEPRVYLTIHDTDGALVRRVKAERKKGLHRLAWDLRWPPAAPTDLRGPGDLMPWERPERGPLVLPGRYKATLETVVGDQLETIAGPVDFEVESLDLAAFSAEDKTAVAAFQAQVRELRRAVLGASELTVELQTRLDHLRQALADTPSADPALMSRVEQLEARLDERQLALDGDRTKAARNVFTPPSISSRIDRISSDQWYSTQAPSETHRKAYAWAAEAFTGELEALKQLVTDLEALEAEAESAGAPWTPGRLPVWNP